MRLLLKVFGILSILLFIVGVIFKFNRIYNADDIIVLGLMLFVIGFSPLFLKIKLAEEIRKDAKISYAAFFISSVLLLIAAQFKILELRGAGELSYFSLLFFMVYIVFFSRSQDSRKLRIRKDRQLAAIMFTDIVGYTRMMGDDEEAGLIALEQNREIHKKWINRYRGKLLKEVGDGIIAIFYTVTETVLCAVDIQKEVKNIKNFEVRIGIHISEIVFTDTDAFGDGVNIASRISNQAEAGEIYFSDGVYQNIRNREKLNIEKMDSRELRNVDQPIQLYKITVT